MAKIVACCSHRFEPMWLVRQWKQNMSWVDEQIIYDDRGRGPSDLWHNEAERYRWFHKKAGEANADYVIVTAPDERMDVTAPAQIARAIERGSFVGFSFKVLELYKPGMFRSDGAWDTYYQMRMYRWAKDQTFADGDVHHSVCPDLPDNTMTLKTVIYHLKHIEEGNRQKRVDIFNKLDPKKKHAENGYEYLADNTGMELTPIRVGYVPPYDRPYHFNPTLLQES